MTVPEMHSVVSSCVARIGYDAGAGEAFVEFHHSGLYGYQGVPGSVFDDFVRAESKGTFLNEVIKPRYPARRIGRGSSS